jgi:hypothetical protein
LAKPRRNLLKSTMPHVTAPALHRGRRAACVVAKGRPPKVRATLFIFLMQPTDAHCRTRCSMGPQTEFLVALVKRLFIHAVSSTKLLKRKALDSTISTFSITLRKRQLPHRSARWQSDEYGLAQYSCKYPLIFSPRRTDTCCERVSLYLGGSLIGCTETAGSDGSLPDGDVFTYGQSPKTLSFTSSTLARPTSLPFVPERFFLAFQLLANGASARCRLSHV